MRYFALLFFFQCPVILLAQNQQVRKDPLYIIIEKHSFCSNVINTSIKDSLGWYGISIKDTMRISCPIPMTTESFYPKLYPRYQVEKLNKPDDKMLYSGSLYIKNEDPYMLLIGINEKLRTGMSCIIEEKEETKYWDTGECLPCRFHKDLIVGSQNVFFPPGDTMVILAVTGKISMDTLSDYFQINDYSIHYIKRKKQSGQNYYNRHRPCDTSLEGKKSLLVDLGYNMDTRTYSPEDPPQLIWSGHLDGDNLPDLIIKYPGANYQLVLSTRLVDYSFSGSENFCTGVGW
ncbi:MAG: hypothetical protein ACJ75J_02805 [Cytophagaceae bacterium]